MHVYFIVMIKIYRISPHGPDRFAIIPFGRQMLWNSRAWTRLWPLYTFLWFVPGLQIGRTVPSIKPKQLVSGAPLSCIELA